MRSVLIVSPHPASRDLLARILAEPEVKVSATGDADEAFAAIKTRRPALVVVDLRRPDEDHPLFLALLRKRHPALPVIALIPGRMRIFDGQAECVQDVQRADPTEGLRVMLDMLRDAMHDLLTQHVLRVLRTPVGQA